MVKSAAILLLSLVLASVAGAEQQQIDEVVQSMRNIRNLPPRPYVVLNRFVCGVDVRLGRGEQMDDSVCPSNFKLMVDHESKTLTSSQRSLFGRYHLSTTTLSVFYLPIGSMGPTQAGTSIPANYISDYKDDNAQDRAFIGALAIFPMARASANAVWVLPHEMGHILINDRPAHLKNAPGNLMEEFNTGRTLTREQCGKIRESPFLLPRRG